MGKKKILVPGDIFSLISISVRKTAYKMNVKTEFIPR